MAAVRKIRNWSKCYKDMYDNILDQKIAHIIQCVDAPNNTLFEIIDKIRKEYPSIDPELVQIIIQGELDRHISAPTCTCCGTKAHKNIPRKKSVLPPSAPLSFNARTMLVPNVKTSIPRTKMLLI